MFEGEFESVGRLVGYAEEGPPEAQVERVEIFEEEVEDLAGFEAR